MGGEDVDSGEKPQIQGVGAVRVRGRPGCACPAWSPTHSWVKGPRWLGVWGCQPPWRMTPGPAKTQLHCFVCSSVMW